MITVLILLISLFSTINIYGFESLPRLRWVKAASEFSSAPQYFLNFSEGTFLSAGNGKIDVVDARDGTVKQTISGIYMSNGFTCSKENGYVAVGGNKITLLDYSLEISWSKPVLDGLTLASAVQTSDSGFIALGKTNDTTGLIIKTDRNLNIIWTRIISNPFLEDDEYFPSPSLKCFRTAEIEGGYVACGTYFDLLWENAWVFKITYKGEIEWSQVFDGLYLYDMIPVENGMALSGRLDSGAKPAQKISSNSSLAKTSRFVPLYASVFHLDADGNLLQILSMNEGWINTVRKQTNTFIVASFFSSYTTSLTFPIVEAIGEDGTTKWEKTYSNSTNGRPVAQPLSSNDLVVFASDSIYYYSNATGVSQKSAISSKTGIRVTDNKLFYTLPNASFIEISLYSLNGKMICNVKKGLQPVGEHSLLLSELARGTCIIRVKSNGQEVIQQRAVIY
jgi:hypothetical protein